MAHVAKYKKDIVKEFESLIKEYPIVGAVNMENLPGPALQKMRAQLRGKVEMKMSKRRLIKLAIDKCKESKKGIEELEKHLRGMPALLFTKENPFSLYKTIKQNKSNAPAKAGQTAPSDIKISAGATPFAPGPIIGELGSVGLKTGVENGKVAIKEDKIVAKEGDVISAKLAGLLTRLGIEPMEIGLDLVAVYEDGIIYGKSVLDIDEDKFNQDLNNAAAWAYNLAFEIGYTTKDNIEQFIIKAFNDSKALATEADVLTDVTAADVLSKAERQMLALKALIPDAPKQEEKKEESKEEPKEAEKKE